MRLASLLIVVTLTSVARAEEPKSPEASARFKQGLEAYTNQRYAEASEHFSAAYEIEPQPDLLWSWAQSERFAGHCVTAVGLYRKYEREAQKESKAKAARDMIALCEPTEPTTPPHQHWYQDKLVVGLGATGLVGVGVGATFLVLASSSHSAANDAMFLDDYQAKLDETTLRRRIGGISLGVGAVALAASVTVYVIHFRQHDTVMTAGTDGRTVFVGARF